MTRLISNTAILLTCLCFTVSAANAESRSLIDEVVKEYKAGNYDKAALLLQDDLAKNPDDGVTHYYLGMVKKKLGDDGNALNELEWAARLCPPEMIQGLASQALNDDKGESLPKLPNIITPKSDWFSMLGTSVSQVFGAPKAEPKVTAEGDIMMPPPVMFSSMDDLIRQGKKLVKSGVDKAKKVQPGSQYKSWASTVMPMEDMMDLVDKSKSLNTSKWASHSDGLNKFRQSPENTPEWDFWIQRYTRAFQHILTSHLFRDGKGEVTGKAAVIFSIDNRGNLRGHIYASTGDGVLNTALIKTIQNMNHSRILEFPESSKVTGFNFRMTWDYGKILRYIAVYKAYKAAIEKKELEETIRKQTEALLLKAKEVAADKAKAEKLKALREKQIARAKAKLKELSMVKTDVVGQVLLPVRPAELQAVAQSIGDPNIKSLGNVPEDQQIDPFKNLSDKQIMSWPDLNR